MTEKQATQLLITLYLMMIFEVIAVVTYVARGFN